MVDRHSLLSRFSCGDAAPQSTHYTSILARRPRLLRLEATAIHGLVGRDCVGLRECEMCGIGIIQRARTYKDE